MNLKEKIYRLLRHSEKYIKTDMIYLVKGSFWLVLGQIISAITAFLLLLAFANLIEPSVYGNYKYLLSIFGLLSIFSLTGMGNAVSRAVARGFEGSVVDSFKTKIKWASVGSIVIIMLAIYYWLQGNNNLPIPLILAALFLPLMQASLIYGDFLSGKKIFTALTKFSSLTSVLVTFLLIIILFLTKNLFIIIAAYLIGYTSLNFIFFTIVLRKFKPNQKTDDQTISYGKHLSLMDILNIIANYLDRLLIFQFLGATELAIYSLAIAPPEKLKGYLKNIYTLAIPKFSLRSREEIKATIYKKMSRFALFIIVIIILYIIFIPFVFRLFFPKYLISVVYSQIFAIGLIGTTAALPQSALLSQMAKKQLYQINIIIPLVQIFLLFVLIYFWGLWGAIIARLITRVFILIFFSWGIKQI